MKPLTLAILHGGVARPCAHRRPCKQSFVLRRAPGSPLRHGAIRHPARIHAALTPRHSRPYPTGLRSERRKAVPDLRVRRSGSQEIHGGHPGHAGSYAGQGKIAAVLTVVYPRAYLRLCFRWRQGLLSLNWTLGILGCRIGAKPVTLGAAVVVFLPSQCNRRILQITLQVSVYS